MADENTLRLTGLPATVVADVPVDPSTVQPPSREAPDSVEEQTELPPPFIADEFDSVIAQYADRGIRPDGTSAISDSRDATATARDILSRENVARNSASPLMAAQGQQVPQNSVLIPVYIDTESQVQASHAEVYRSRLDYAVGLLPHGFVERQHQVYHHEIMVYIQGVNVSSWLQGSVSIQRTVGSEPGSCEITLNNAVNRFTLTPENFQGVWRLGSDVGAETEYDEREKKAIFDIKNPVANNPTDPLSGGRMWPLDHGSAIFHKMDPIRVWVHNPLDPDKDEWLPMFSGYVVGVHLHTDHVTHDSSITLSCKDIRYIMQLMRTNTNSVLFVQPGSILTENSAQYDTSARAGIGGGAFSSNFFEDLVVINNTFANPWANVSLFAMISALTYGGRSPQQVVTAAAEQYLSRANQELASAERELNGMPAGDPRREATQARVNQFRAQVAQGQNQNAGGQPGNANASGAQPNATVAQQNQSVAQQQSNNENSQRPSGRGRIGRLSRGMIYRYPSMALLNDADDETDTPVSDQDVGGELLHKWNNILTFGFPNRTRSEQASTTGLWLNGVIDTDTSTCTYWTKSQVMTAGSATQSNRAWAPDTQLVHVLKPAGISSGDAVIQDNTFITSGGGAVNTQLSFTTRLDLLSQACEAADYRFWVTATGDLVFEFPQYDFDTNDYNKVGSILGWQSVYEYNEHTLSEDYDAESGEAITCVIVVGGLTGYSQFSEVGGGDTSNTALAPETQPHAVCWSPTLTMRHGVNIKTLSLPLISDSARLTQIAAMTFQRFLGQMSTYTMDAAYRPWVLPNRPILSRTRYSLTDGVHHTVPVRESAGSPATNLTLTYPRNFDQFGVPRFLTGGPSLPIFYGKIPGRGTLTSRLRDQSVRIQRLMASLGSDGLASSAEALQEYRNQSSVVPTGYDQFNIISLAVAEGRPLTMSALQDDVASLISEIDRLNGVIEQLRNDTTLTPEDIRQAGLDIQQQIADITQRLQSLGVDIAPGSTPSFGQSGVRTPNDTQQPNAADLPPNEVDLCNLDGLPYSSPLGRSSADQSFPRTLIRGFSGRHQAVDYAAIAGENVYAVSDGIVQQIGTNRAYGKFVKIKHNGSFTFSVYSPITPKSDVTVGAEVKRNQVLGTVSSSDETTDLGQPVFHFSLGQARPVATGEQTSGGGGGAPPRFVPPQQFPFNPPTLMTAAPRGAFYASFANNRGAQRNAQATRIHAGFDIKCAINTPIYATTGGTLLKIHSNGPGDEEEGFGVQIKDSAGATHGYFHFNQLPTVTMTNPTIAKGQLLGYAGSTGRSGDVHLHYQITLNYSRYTTSNGEILMQANRVDVGPRLAALYAGLTCNPAICKQEAASVYQKETGLKQPRLPIPDDSPDSPVDGLTVAQIYQRVGIQGAQDDDSPEFQVVYYDTAVPPDTGNGVPYKALPQIGSSDDLTFALVGDADASSLVRQLGSSLGAYLNRTVSIANKGVVGSKVSQWLETQDIARQRTGGAARTRRANIDEARTIAASYKVILVCIGSSEELPQGMSGDSITAFDQVLRSQGALVIWCTQIPYPGSKVVSTGQTIEALIQGGAPRENADAHVNAAVKSAAASVAIADATSRNVGDVSAYYQRNLTTYNTNGTNVVAGLLAPQIVSILRSARSQDVTASDDVSIWSRAVPPEDCPPLRQRRLQGATPADGVNPVPNAQVDPESAPAPSTTTPPDQVRPVRRRRSRT